VYTLERNLTNVLSATRLSHSPAVLKVTVTLTQERNLNVLSATRPFQVSAVSRITSTYTVGRNLNNVLFATMLSWRPAVSINTTAHTGEKLDQSNVQILKNVGFPIDKFMEKVFTN
jgi:hypothetical protein